MILFHTDQTIALRLSERNWHNNYNNFKLSQNLQSQQIWKQIEKYIENYCGGSNDLNRIKIDPWKGVASDDFISYWPKHSIDWAKKIEIKITTISTCRKLFISQQIWKQITGHVREIDAVLTI